MVFSSLDPPSEASWDEVNRVATVAHLLTVVVTKCPELLKPEMWDFITCSLVSWTGENFCLIGCRVHK